MRRDEMKTLSSVKGGDEVIFPLTLEGGKKMLARRPRASRAPALSLLLSTQLFHWADEARWPVFSSAHLCIVH